MPAGAEIMQVYRGGVELDSRMEDVLGVSDGFDVG